MRRQIDRRSEGRDVAAVVGRRQLTRAIECQYTKARLLVPLVVLVHSPRVLPAPMPAVLCVHRDLLLPQYMRQARTDQKTGLVAPVYRSEALAAALRRAKLAGTSVGVRRQRSWSATAPVTRARWYSDRRRLHGATFKLDPGPAFRPAGCSAATSPGPLRLAAAHRVGGKIAVQSLDVTPIGTVYFQLPRWNRFRGRHLEHSSTSGWSM